MKLSEVIVICVTLILVVFGNLYIDIRQTDQIVELRNRIQKLEQLH